MQNVDLRGYCYERERAVVPDELYDDRGALFKVLIVFAIIGSFLCVILYGKQQTLAAYYTIEHAANVNVMNVKICNSVDFSLNGKNYVRFTTSESGNRAFTLEQKKFNKIFGKQGEGICRVLTVKLSCDLGTLRTTRSGYTKLCESHALKNLVAMDDMLEGLNTGDEYSVFTSDCKNTLGIFYNVPVRSLLVVREYQFGVDTMKFTVNDSAFIDSNKALMRMKNDKVHNMLSEYASNNSNFLHRTRFEFQEDAYEAC